MELRLGRVGGGDRQVDREPRLLRDRGVVALGPIRDVIDPANVVVDGKSGMTGAGRTLKESSHAGFVLENVSPYKVGRHQHVGEISQLLGFPVTFAPHLLPVRGTDRRDDVA